jgi:CheY-specific phosphatase CheX
MNCSDNLTASAVDRASEWCALLEASTREVFSLMLGVELGQAEGQPADADSTVTAFVGIGGDMRGVVSLISSTEAVRGMASAMMGIPPEEAGGVAWDAFGEICNMVGGNFKGKLVDTHPHCVLSLPTVITGADYRIRVLSNGLAAEARLSFEGHLFRVLLEVQQHETAS